MPPLFVWTLLALAGVWGLSFVVVLGCLPHWLANAADGDAAQLGILDLADRA
jgi:hypothetical protein